MKPSMGKYLKLCIVVVLYLATALLAEIMAVATIVVYTWRMYRTGGQIMSLTQLLLREGLLYFV